MDSIDEIKASLIRLESDVHDIKRGLYGDSKNKVKGLIDIADRVTSLEESKKKFMWVLFGAGVVIEFLIHILKDFVIK